MPPTVSNPTPLGTVPQVGDWLRLPDGTAAFVDCAFERGVGGAIAVMQGAWHGTRCHHSPYAREAKDWPRTQPTDFEVAVVRDFVAGMTQYPGVRPDEWAHYKLALDRLDAGTVGDLGAAA